MLLLYHFLKKMALSHFAGNELVLFRAGADSEVLVLLQSLKEISFFYRKYCEKKAV